MATHKPQTAGAGLRTALWLLLAGALQAASLAWPVALPQSLDWLGLTQGQALWFLQWLALASLVGGLRTRASWQVAAWRGWLFATAWLACTFGWLFTSMHTYGGLAAPLAILAVLALAGLLALYYAAAAGLFRLLARDHSVLAALAFAALWLLAEMARGVLLSGFGWGAIGYAHLAGPLAGLLPWVGLYGVSFVAALLAAGLALGWRSALGARWGEAARLALLLLALLLLPSWLPEPQGGSAGTLAVTLLQGNIPQNEKFDAETGVIKALQWYGEQLQQNQSPLIITPETALPLLPEQLPGLATAFCGGRSGGAGRCAAGQFQRGLHQFGGRAQARAVEPLALRQAPSGAFWRVHSAVFSLVHRADEHPAGRLQPGRPAAAHL